MYTHGAKERIIVRASEGQFGEGDLLTPMTFRVNITWALSKSDCKSLGCPVFDPRVSTAMERHDEIKSKSVYLKTGGSLILNGRLLIHDLSPDEMFSA